MARLSLVRAIAALLALLACAAVPAAARALVPPEQDPFYDRPAKLRDAARGEVLRSRPATITGLGIPLPYDAWQVVYRSNDSKGRPAHVIGTVVVPRTPYPGKRPLVSYQVAIDSLAPHCNPSYTFQTGTNKEIPLAALALTLGWAVVIPDFEGPRDAYGAGPMAGQATLDGIRAARRFRPAGLAGSQVGLWGYSGGGQATAWAAELQPTYAPRLRIDGVAAGGVPPNLLQVARQIDGGPFAGVYFAVSVGLSREFPELRIDSLLNDAGRAMVAKIGEECADDLVTGYPFQRMSQYTTVPDALAVPRVRKVARANNLGKDTPTAPLFVYHSALDELIPVRGPDEMVAEYCREGATVQYERSLLGEHVAFAVTGAPLAIDYLGDRFAGQPPPSNC